MNEYTFDEITVGQSESFVRTVTPEMEDAFRAITGDENPLHRDDDFAREIGEGRFPSHVAFGMLTASFYSTLAGMYLPGKYSLIHSFDRIDFKKPVFSGDELTITGTVRAKLDDLKLLFVDAVIRNQKNQVVSKAGIKVLVLK